MFFFLETIRIIAGENATLMCSKDSNGNKWQKYNNESSGFQDLIPTERLKGTNTNSMTIQNTAWYDSGIYQCVRLGQNGSITGSYHAIVLEIGEC